jgi:hypothetical protein
MDADTDELTTIATFTSTAEAELARERLELEGLQGFVLDQVTSAVMPYATAGGSVRLQVATEDVERAREALGLGPA